MSCVYVLFDNIDAKVSCVSDSLSKLSRYYFEEIISDIYDLESYMICDYGLSLPLNYEDQKVNDIDVSDCYHLFESVLV